MNFRGILQPSLDDINVVLERRDAAGRLRLACLQDVDNAGKRRDVDDSVRLDSAIGSQG